MHDPVEVVAAQIKRVFQPKTKRYFRVSVVRSDRVQREKERDQEIGQIRQWKSTVGQRQTPDENKDQQVFQQPV
jgi:hypothetical protein